MWLDLDHVDAQEQKEFIEMSNRYRTDPIAYLGVRMILHAERIRTKEADLEARKIDTYKYARNEKPVAYKRPAVRRYKRF